jgi:hypothetical protein
MSVGDHLGARGVVKVNSDLDLGRPCLGVWSPLCARCPALPLARRAARRGLGRRRKKSAMFPRTLASASSETLRLPSSLRRRYAHNARPCVRQPPRQASVFSSVPNCPGYPLLCHGNITTTGHRPLPRVLTRGPGKDVSVSVPVASAPSTQQTGRFLTSPPHNAPHARVCAGHSQRGRLRIAAPCVTRRAMLPVSPSLRAQPQQSASAGDRIRFRIDTGPCCTVYSGAGP